MVDRFNRQWLNTAHTWETDDSFVGLEKTVHSVDDVLFVCVNSIPGAIKVIIRIEILVAVLATFWVVDLAIKSVGDDLIRVQVYLEKSDLLEVE